MSKSTSVAGKASALLRMHHSDSILVLPTVWDAWSAQAAVEAGFGALSVGSHPLAASRGQRDGEDMSLADALEGAQRITRAVQVPVTVDLESGYGTAADELVERALDAGIAGINVEDTVHSEGRLREPSEHADYIGRLRAAADAAGVELVINARTDVFKQPDGTFTDPVSEAVTRLRACEQAGARCLYPILVPDLPTLRAVLAEVASPVNVIAHPRTGSQAGSLAELRAAGVRRITFGPFLQRELATPLQDLLATWH